jgi:GlcNAc-P-P-Und epimerase
LSVVTVIGGAGFIGTELVRQLLDSGHNVRIADKRQSVAFPQLWTEANVLDPSTLRRTLSGSDVVYNLAAEHKDNVRPVSLYHDVNVEGARNVCSAAEELSVPTIVFTSSVAVYGAAEPESDETATLRPVNEYGRTKMLAEGVYREWLAAKAGRSLTIVRPTVVFGPRNRGNVFNLLNLIATGRFVMVGSGKSVKSMAFVDNVAAFLRYVLALGPGEHLFNYVDKPDFSTESLFRAARRSLGRSDHVGIRVPYPIGYAGGLLADFVSRLLHKELPISAIRIRKFCATTQFRSSRVAAVGFRPPVTLQDGLQRTVVFEFLGGRESAGGGEETFDTE